jgi:hypothetical protein
MKVLLTVIAITPSYLCTYNNIFRKSHEFYAKKHGYDFRVIDYMLDCTVNHTSAFSFQKILVCSQGWSEKYDYIVCIDGDIFINPDSPSIHTCIDFEGKIGVVDEKQQPTLELREKYDGVGSEYYKRAGLDVVTRMELNTGVMVFQPKLHCNFLRSIFDRYVRGCMTSNLGYHYEQSTVGYEFIVNDMYKIIPGKFNAIWGLCKEIKETSDVSMEQFFKGNYFMHFAGNVDWYVVPDVLHKFIPSD